MKKYFALATHPANECLTGGVSSDCYRRAEDVRH
jgi:hypothetical protein